jgi:hypothetical protein
MARYCLSNTLAQPKKAPIVKENVEIVTLSLLAAGLSLCSSVLVRLAPRVPAEMPSSARCPPSTRLQFA